MYRYKIILIFKVIYILILIFKVLHIIFHVAILKEFFLIIITYIISENYMTLLQIMLDL